MIPGNTNDSEDGRQIGVTFNKDDYFTAPRRPPRIRPTIHNDDIPELQTRRHGHAPDVVRMHRRNVCVDRKYCATAGYQGDEHKTQLDIELVADHFTKPSPKT